MPTSVDLRKDTIPKPGGLGSLSSLVKRRQVDVKACLEKGPTQNPSHDQQKL